MWLYMHTQRHTHYMFASVLVPLFMLKTMSSNWYPQFWSNISGFILVFSHSIFVIPFLIVRETWLPLTLKCLLVWSTPLSATSLPSLRPPLHSLPHPLPNLEALPALPTRGFSVWLTGKKQQTCSLECFPKVSTQQRFGAFWWDFRCRFLAFPLLKPLELG